MRLMAAIKNYLETDPHGKKVPAGEMIEFAKTLTPQERDAAKVELRSYGMVIED